MRILDRTIHLIDTPGFDDSVRSDEETLQELAYWLVKAYERSILLSGIVLLHRITDTGCMGQHSERWTLSKQYAGKKPSVELSLRQLCGIKCPLVSARSHSIDINN